MTSASASSPESERQGQHCAAAAQTPAPARLSLAQLLQRFGAAACQDPHRCAALIRDLCDGSYREHFLWTAALQEGIVAELRSPAPGLPTELLLAGLERKLADRLGLRSEAAAWAVRAWSEALQHAPETTAETFPPAIASLSGHDDITVHTHGRQWLAWCTAALASTLTAIIVAAWCSFHFDVVSIGHWLRESALLCAGCAVGWLGLRISSRRLMNRARPQWSHLRPASAVAAALPEILLVLLLPLAPVAAFALWAAASWTTWPDASGPTLVAWVLARVFQALLLTAFVMAWTPPMLATEGRLVSGWREPL